MKKGDYNIILKYISSQNIILLLGKLFPQYIHRTILTIHYYYKAKVFCFAAIFYF